MVDLRGRSVWIAGGFNARTTIPKGFAIGDDVGSGKPKGGKIRW